MDHNHRLMEWRAGLAALLAAGLVMLAANAASAATVYGTAVTDEDPAAVGLNGARTVGGGGLVPTRDGYWSNASLSWDITQEGSVYTYEYTFEGFAGKGRWNPDISHAVFDLSDDAIGGDALSDPGAVSDVRLDGTAVSGDRLEFGDFQGITGSFKVESVDEDIPGNPSRVTFDSNRAPVWGDLFVKSGQTNLTNRGFGTTGHGLDEAAFIARPNGLGSLHDGDGGGPHAVIPLPAAVWPGLVVLGGVMAGRRWRRTAGARSGGLGV